MDEDLEALYFNWLCAKVLDHSNVAYTRLLELLHCEEFMWLLPRDENRAEDGKDLRKDFFIASFIQEDPTWSEQPCSVLEMLIALAKRAEWQVGHAKGWFWTFIENMGLKDPYVSEMTFGDHMHILIWRLYKADGSQGGLFPLHNDFGDQRKEELWYQLNHYIEENCTI